MCVCEREREREREITVDLLYIVTFSVDEQLSKRRRETCPKAPKGDVKMCTSTTSNVMCTVFMVDGDLIGQD